MVPRDALVLTEPINSPQAAYRTSALRGSQMGISGMKNLSVTPVAGAKQKQEWALHFRDSSHSRSEMRDRTLRNARENRQNDLSLRFQRSRPSAFFAMHLGSPPIFLIHSHSIISRIFPLPPRPTLPPPPFQ